MRSTIDAIFAVVAVITAILASPTSGGIVSWHSGITTRDLTRAERRLIDATRKGTVASYLTGMPAHDDPRGGSEWNVDRTLRAEVIYALVTGGNPKWPVRVEGVRILGARISGFLNLEGTPLKYPLAIERSFIYEPILLRDASSRSISFAGSYIAGITTSSQLPPVNGRLCLLADGLQADGSVSLNEGFTGQGEVRIVDATIKGNLDCGHSVIRNPGGCALDATGSRITGDVRLDNGFQAKGAVNLRDAEIGRELIGTDGNVESSTGDSLDACYIRVRGNILLDKGFSATGRVCLTGAEVGGDLNCSGGRFRSGNQTDTTALDLEQASVAKTLYLLGSVPDGSLNLNFAHVHVLSDDQGSWPLPGALKRDGFVYDEIDPSRSPTDAQSRLAWLSLQRTPYFSSQPYEQLAKVLSEMGYSDDAKDVLIAEHEAMRTQGNLGIAGRCWNWILYLMVGYGYRVWFSLLWALGAVIAGAAIFKNAANTKILVRQGGSLQKPSNVAIDDSSTEQSWRGQLDQWFYYFIYSLEVFCPFPGFGREKHYC